MRKPFVYFYIYYSIFPARCQCRIERIRKKFPVSFPFRKRFSALPQARYSAEENRTGFVRVYLPESVIVFYDRRRILS